MKKHLNVISLVTLSAACLAFSVQADEASALKTLGQQDATLENRAKSCIELGRVGTAGAVPALSALLADVQLHDYARDALERIPDAAAGKALLDALGSLQGHQRAGIIITLGDRGEASAVPALTKIAQGDGPAASAALTALAQIATEPATKVIHAALKKNKSIANVNAALIAADRLETAGNKGKAAALRKAAGK